ncbi:MAG: hypothetical protein IH865_01790 [Chloroflexi bacterium]|nr:hypothetical protein [Chloroflexota bacterium]
MVSNKGTDEDQLTKPRDERGSLGRLILRVASQLFGGTVVTTKPPTQDAAAPKEETPGATDMASGPEQSYPEPGSVLKRSSQAAEAAENLGQTLDHFEAMLDALESHVQPGEPSSATVSGTTSAALRPGTTGTMNGSVERLERMLNRLATQAQRLADGASDLALVAGEMEGRLGEVARAVREAPAREPVAQPALIEDEVEVPEKVLEPDAPAEPQFDPADSPLSVALAGVPGFQGLMDAQRALTGLPEAEGASVVAFKNGEAALEVVLNAPVTARQIVDGVRNVTGEQLVIEESRPEAARLRLRFVDRAGGANA